MVETPDEMEEKSARIMFDLINKRLQHTSLYSTWLSVLYNLLLATSKA